MKKVKENNQVKITIIVRNEIKNLKYQNREMDTTEFYYSASSRHLNLNQLMKEAFVKQ